MRPPIHFRPPEGKPGSPPTPVDQEELLWHLPSAGEEDDREPPPDDILRAYREGRLDAAERNEVEALLVTSTAARERLAALAGVAPVVPPPELRERVLLSARPQRLPGRVLISALALAAALVLAVTGVLQRSARVPDETKYEVVASGLSEVRGGPLAGARNVTTLPSTTVRIDATPIAGASARVTVGLYGLRRGHLERLDTGERVAVTSNRGAVRFTARAADLVGSAAGDHIVYVVVARTGDLPAAVDLRGEDDPASSLAAGLRRQVYPQRITVLEEVPAAENGRP